MNKLSSRIPGQNSSTKALAASNKTEGSAKALEALHSYGEGHRGKYIFIRTSGGNPRISTRSSSFFDRVWNRLTENKEIDAKRADKAVKQIDIHLDTLAKKYPTNSSVQSTITAIKTAKKELNENGKDYSHYQFTTELLKNLKTLTEAIDTADAAKRKAVIDGKVAPLGDPIGEKYSGPPVRRMEMSHKPPTGSDGLFDIDDLLSGLPVPKSAAEFGGNKASKQEEIGPDDSPNSDDIDDILAGGSDVSKAVNPTEITEAQKSQISQIMTGFTATANSGLVGALGNRSLRGTIGATEAAKSAGKQIASLFKETEANQEGTPNKASGEREALKQNVIYFLKNNLIVSSPIKNQGLTQGSQEHEFMSLIVNSFSEAFEKA